ncbi:hypothetical protein SEA_WILLIAMBOONE_138 [Gordonia phage WilliamBoone]|nr:hypothetical protein SEA_WILLIAMBOONE_138 [Gordonia phage WilliamBoone]
MPMFSVYFINHTSGVVAVEAADADDAIEKGYDEFDYPYLCHQCARGRNDGEWYAEAVADEEGKTLIEGLEQ